ncbi:pseudouridine synthase [Candidatus Saganbacteria bacterium]|nr:pseudouridine synthase [Candidatus Saganbacteria bacterium]
MIYNPQKVYLIFNKPYGVLCQFTDELGRKTLKNFIPIQGIYPVGRLDFDSEGLVFLTNDGELNQQLSNPRFKLPKTYLVQIEGVPTEEELYELRHGVFIEGRKTKAAKVEVLDEEPELWPREKPIRFRKSVPTTWIKLSIVEGKYHQVKRMTAAVGHPCLRLVRVKIGLIDMRNLQPGKYLFIKKPIIR